MSNLDLKWAFRKPRPVNYVKLPVLRDPQKLKNVVVKTDDPLFSLLKYEDSANVHSDVWLLTNLNRLKFSNPTEVARMIDERFKLRPESNPYVGMSDDDIFTTIKDKNIQSASELNSWLDYLDSAQSDVVTEMERISKKSENSADVTE